MLETSHVMCACLCDSWCATGHLHWLKKQAQLHIAHIFSSTSPAVYFTVSRKFLSRHCLSHVLDHDAIHVTVIFFLDLDEDRPPLPL